MTLKQILCGAVLAGALGGLVAHANDSSASFELGGLTLTQNDTISMDKEDLFLSADEVRVEYQYTNTSDEDVDLLISFPLPAMPYNNAEYLGDRQQPDWSGFDFETKVDGEPVAFDIRQIPMANGRDVTPLIKHHGFEMRHWEDEAWTGKMQALPFLLRDIYEATGFLVRDENEAYLQPGWAVETHVTRKQMFPAGETVNVSHRYTPETGSSMGGNFSDYDYEGADEEKNDFYAAYCVDDSFQAALKQKKAERGEWAEAYTETYLDYRLSPGANWKGPIKEFRLVIDKGDPNRWISLCMDDVKKISPTQFEVTRTDFEPAKDINIVFLNWADVPEE